MKAVMFRGNIIQANDCAEVDHAFSNNMSLEEAMLIVNNPSDLTADMVDSGLFHILGRKATAQEVLACLPPQPAQEL